MKFKYSAVLSGIAIALFVLVLFQQFMLKKSETVLQSVIERSNQYQKYIVSSFPYTIEEAYQCELDSLRKEEGNVVVFVPPYVCWACFMSLLAYFDEIEYPKTDIEFYMSTDSSNVFKAIKAKGYTNISYVDIVDVFDGEDSIFISKLGKNGWQTNYLSFSEGDEIILSLFLQS